MHEKYTTINLQNPGNLGTCVKMCDKIFCIKSPGSVSTSLKALAEKEMIVYDMNRWQVYYFFFQDGLSIITKGGYFWLFPPSILPNLPDHNQHNALRPRILRHSQPYSGSPALWLNSP